ncbi:MFS general substrate transporter [Colletotrichum eremochloae]|nr:MFS general substrate transporter [Colletotrichum eremochloae]
MGTAFSGIPDDNQLVQSPSSPSWFSSSSSKGPDKESRHVVNWHVPYDPENPLDWGTKTRWVQIVLVSILMLQAAMASSMPAPGAASILKEYKAPEGALTSLVVSIFNLGSAFGTMMASPLSELHGRYLVYSISNILFLVCNAACALSPNLSVLLAFRSLSGCTGAVPFVIGSSTIADMVQFPWRSRALSVYSLALMLGSVIGPSVGGFLAQYFGWRWIFWSLCILAAVTNVASLFLLRETSARTLLEKRANKIRKTTGDPEYISALSISGVFPGMAFSEAIKEPFRLLILHPIMFSFSLYFAVVYGVLYLFFTTFPMVFTSRYNFSTGFSGLTFLGIGVGIIIGAVLDLFWGDRIAASLLLKKGIRTPELRLSLMAYSAPLIPTGILLYGWTVEKTIFWLVPMTGTIIFGVGIMLLFAPAMPYLMEAFPFHAASAITALIMLSGIFGAFLPIIGPPVYSALSLGWGNTIIAGITVALVPIPWLIMKQVLGMREKYSEQA